LNSKVVTCHSVSQVHAIGAYQHVVANNTIRSSELTEPCFKHRLVPNLEQAGVSSTYASKFSPRHVAAEEHWHCAIMPWLVLSRMLINSSQQVNTTEELAMIMATAKHVRASQDWR
jgi:hypothetical protein